MGTWGPGIFDSDNAQEYLDVVFRRLFIEIRHGFEAAHQIPGDRFLDQADRKFLPALDVYTTLLIEYDGVPELDLETFKQWRALYFDLFDQDDAINIASFKPSRREAIGELFDKLEAYLVDWYGEA